MNTKAITRYSIERSTTASKVGLLVGLLIIVALVSMPWWAGRGDVRSLTEFFYVLALAQMWNLLAGYGGMVSVGQQAFVGIGAYSLVVFGYKYGIDPFLCVLIAGFVSLIFALPTAAIVFRLRGAYFAVGTWVVAEVYRLLFANITWLGGGSGLSITKVFKGFSSWWREAIIFWLAIAIGVGSIVLIYLLLRSRYGLALTAVRDSERASEGLGVKVRNVKWFVYLASAFGCGMVGALIFLTKLRVSPEAAFSLDWTAIMFFVVVIGGIGTIEGPIIGAIAYFILRDTLDSFGSWYLIVLGLVAVVLMLKAPKGVWGVISDKYDLRLFPVQRRLKFKDDDSQV